MKETINDPTLGTLVFEEQYDWYNTTIQTATDGKVELTIPSDTLSANDDDLTPVRESLPLLLKALPDAKAFIAGDLLEIKNSDWLEDDEEVLTEDQFVSQLTLSSLTAQEDDVWELYFNANELFWGHSILVWWNQTRGFYDAQTAG